MPASSMVSGFGVQRQCGLQRFLRLFVVAECHVNPGEDDLHLHGIPLAGLCLLESL